MRADDFEARIAELKDRVDALAARITSIVAVPSMSPEFQAFSIDSIGKAPKGSAFFTAKFAVTPKAAVKNFTEEDVFKINFKEGLTRGDAAIDTTITVDFENVFVDEANGEFTVILPLAKNIELPVDTVGVDGTGSFNLGYDESIDSWRDFWRWINGERKVNIKNTVTMPKSAVYYSLSYEATDDASEDAFEKASEYVKAHETAEKVTLKNSAKVVMKNAEGEFVDYEGPLAVDDTADYTVAGYAFKKLLTTDAVTVAFEVNGKLLSAAELSELAGRTVNVVVDTFNVDTMSVRNPFNVSNNGTTLKKVNGYAVGSVAKLEAKGFKVNGLRDENFKADLTENFVVGPHTLDPIVLTPAKEEAWTKDSWNKITKTYSFVEGTNAKAIAKAIKGKFMPAANVEDGTITINYISENGVDVKIKDVKRPEKDSTYTITWKQEVVNKLGPNDSTLCQISWTYWIEAAPEGAEIDLGVKDTTLTVATIGNMVIPIDADVVELTFEKLNAACQFDSTEFAEAKAAIKDAFKAPSEDDLVVFNGKDSLVNASYLFDKVSVDQRNIGTYVLSHSATVYGIKYTYTYKINVVEPSTEFVAIDAYTTKEADGSYSIEVKGRVNEGNYVLNVIPFKDYFKLSSKEVTGLKVGFEQIDEVASEGELTFPTTVEQNCEAGADSLHFTAGNIEWNDYDSLKVNVYAYLIAGADTIDQVKILFWSADPISVTAKDGVIKHQPNTADEFDLDSLIVMKDYNDSTVWGVHGKIGDVNYGQNVVFDTDKDNWTVNGKAWNNDLSLTLNERGLLVLAADQATIVTPQVVRIPVKISHNLNQFGDGYPAYVEVTITQE